MQTTPRSKISFQSNAISTIVAGALFIIYATTRTLANRGSMGTGVETFMLVGGGLVLLGAAKQKGISAWVRWLCAATSVVLLAGALYVGVFPLLHL